MLELSSVITQKILNKKTFDKCAPIVCYYQSAIHMRAYKVVKFLSIGSLSPLPPASNRSYLLNPFSVIVENKSAERRLQDLNSASFVIGYLLVIGFCFLIVTARGKRRSVFLCRNGIGILRCSCAGIAQFVDTIGKLTTGIDARG